MIPADELPAPTLDELVAEVKRLDARLADYAARSHRATETFFDVLFAYCEARDLCESAMQVGMEECERLRAALREALPYVEAVLVKVDSPKWATDKIRDVRDRIREALGL